jgi:hypothetical protein
MDNTELHETVERAANDMRDPEAAARARRHMDEMRDKLRKRLGIVDYAVPLVREFRDS